LKRLLFPALLISLTAFCASAQQPRPQESEVTVITADRLTYDSEARRATFEEHVVVTDPDLSLKSDQLTAEFNERNEVISIEAKGNVVIEQADKSAWAGVARYDVQEGKITLLESPRVKSGKDMLEGEVITFWRNESRLICDKRARLVIYPGEGDRKMPFGGGR
jgi:lipopolysaccharide transport protein LptA